MISMRREMSREGVMGISVACKNRPLYAASRRPIPAERPEIEAVSTGWPAGQRMLMARYERSTIVRNRAGAVLRRAGFHHLPGLGPAALRARRNARLRLRPAPRHRAGM